jgi:hypothetical protein
MSLPASENELGADATLPWLLSPKWTPSELALSRKRFTKPPKEALAEISKLYLLQPQFDYPSLQFEDGEPVMTEPYAETQHHLTKLQELLDDLEALKVSREDEARKAKLAGDIRRAAAIVKAWIEQEKARAKRFEERVQFLIAEQAKAQETQPEHSSCLIT